MSIQTKAARGISLLLSLNVFVWLTMLLFFAGILFLAMAAYMSMAIALGPPIAALLTGVGLLVLCFLLVLLLYLTALRAPAKERRTAPPTTPTEQEPLEAVVGPRAAGWLRNHTDAAIVAALLTGTALSASASLRHMLIRTAGPTAIRGLSRVIRKLSEQEDETSARRR
ncbi:MAG TPA: hypothetical protein VK110_10095 [Salinisphaeraceae bacterium]|nr:hypothetical protein [Salinisphaeraceae bacterium]